MPVVFTIQNSHAFGVFTIQNSHTFGVFTVQNSHGPDSIGGTPQIDLKRHIFQEILTKIRKLVIFNS